jgi:hypothetical protein
MDGYAKGGVGSTTATTNRADMTAKGTCDRVRFPRPRTSRGGRPGVQPRPRRGDGVVADVGGENGHCPPDQ